MAFASYTPTQIGRMAWPCTSLSTTMGMLVTGSIIRPRIFISTSMEASLGLNHVLAHQTVRRRSCHMHLNVGSQKLFGLGREICQAVRTCISGPLVFAPRFAAHQHFLRLADHFGVVRFRDFALLVLKDGEPPALLFLRNRVFHFQGGRVGARRVLEGEQVVVLYFIEQAQRLREIGL